jgi:hypothetical protein
MGVGWIGVYKFADPPKFEAKSAIRAKILDKSAICCINKIRNPCKTFARFEIRTIFSVKSDDPKTYSPPPPEISVQRALRLCDLILKIIHWRCSMAASKLLWQVWRTWVTNTFPRFLLSTFLCLEAHANRDWLILSRTSRVYLRVLRFFFLALV